MATASGLAHCLLPLALLACLLCLATGEDEAAEARLVSRCPKGLIFRNGLCMCSPGFTQCGTKCKNLQKDATSCGRCDKVCERLQTCLAGRCTSKKCGARPGFIQCPTAIGGKTFAKTCYNSRADPNHCGGCNRKCQQGFSCINGACAVQCGGLVFAEGSPGVEQNQFDTPGKNILTIQFDTSTVPPAAQGVVCGLTTTPATATAWNASKSRGQQWLDGKDLPYLH